MESKRGGIDLHAHTTASDGSLSPTELVEKAARLGLEALAVTDHDTIAGLAEAVAAAKDRSIELIPGVELSVEDESGRFHMLGYGVDPGNALLLTTLERLRAARARRNDRIMDRVRELGLPIAWDDVLRQAGDGGEVVARPHFAAALIEKGAAASVSEAFDRYLSPGRPLYFPKSVLSPAEAAGYLHQSGAVAVMAHPGLSKWSDPARLQARLEELRADAGLDGLEVYYNKHETAQEEAYAAVAERVGLFATGGSDFHGTPKPDVALGDVRCGLPAPAELLGPLKDALRRKREAVRS